ncbi:MAG TPA: mechanosensitive ion channel family protein [Rhodocyclaceae bacterium]
MLAEFLREVLQHFWQPEQPWLIVGGLLLWSVLRRALPDGSQYVLKQTIAFFVLCLFGELGASLMEALSWGRVAAGFYELSLIGVGISLIRFAGLTLFRVVMPALRVETPRILEDITVIAGYGALAMVRLRYAGLDLSHIVATSAVITAIAAFAMQDTLGNILGGLAIHLDHSVEIGDWVVVDGVSGRIIDIRWRYTKIATRNGEKVVLPNSVLMKNKISVVGIYGGKGNAWRRWVWFNVGLDHAPRQVINVVERELREATIANVAHEPAPAAVLMEFGAGYARYALRYWLTDPLYDDPTDSEVRLHVFVALERAGIALALPEEVRHLVKEDQSREHLLAERELHRRMEVLSQVALFQGMSREELKVLAPTLTHAPFAAGDIVTRQGAAAHWLYILISGEAEVWLEAAAGERRLMATLQGGQVFGEMSLLTGEPRRATVIARSDVDTYRLDKSGLDALIRARPAIAEEISHILAERDEELIRARQDLDDFAAARREAASHETILSRIRSFFGLTG